MLKVVSSGSVLANVIPVRPGSSDSKSGWDRDWQPATARPVARTAPRDNASTVEKMVRLQKRNRESTRIGRESARMSLRLEEMSSSQKAQSTSRQSNHPQH